MPGRERERENICGWAIKPAGPDRPPCPGERERELLVFLQQKMQDTLGFRVLEPRTEGTQKQLQLSACKASVMSRVWTLSADTGTCFFYRCKQLEKRNVTLSSALCLSSLQRTRAVDGTLPTCDVTWLSNSMATRVCRQDGRSHVLIKVVATLVEAAIEASTPSAEKVMFVHPAEVEAESEGRLLVV